MAGTKPELEPSVGEDVGRSSLSSEQGWIPEADIQYQRSHSQPLSRIGRRYEQGERGRRTQMVGREDGVVAKTLDLPTPLREGVGRRDAENVRGETKNLAWRSPWRYWVYQARSHRS
jgi:hypothetical protein